MATPKYKRKTSNDDLNNAISDLRKRRLAKEMRLLEEKVASQGGGMSGYNTSQTAPTSTTETGLTRDAADSRFSKDRMTTPEGGYEMSVYDPETEKSSYTTFRGTPAQSKQNKTGMRGSLLQAYSDAVNTKAANLEGGRNTRSANTLAASNHSTDTVSETAANELDLDEDIFTETKNRNNTANLKEDEDEQKARLNSLMTDQFDPDTGELTRKALSFKESLKMMAMEDAAFEQYKNPSASPLKNTWITQRQRNLRNNFGQGKSVMPKKLKTLTPEVEEKPQEGVERNFINWDVGKNWVDKRREEDKRQLGTFGPGN